MWPNPSIRKYFCSNLKPQPHPETEEQKIKSKLASVTTIVNVAQTAKKATYLMTTFVLHSTIPLAVSHLRPRPHVSGYFRKRRLHLPSTRKQHFRPQICRFLKTLSRLDFLKTEIYRFLVGADFFQIRKKSPFSKISGSVWMARDFK